METFTQNSTAFCYQAFIVLQDKLSQALELGRLYATATWLRLSSLRLLTWNKNYNIKPREISAAQVSGTLLAFIAAPKPVDWAISGNLGSELMGLLL